MERGLSIDTTLLGGQQGERCGLRCATRSSRWGYGCWMRWLIVYAGDAGPAAMPTRERETSVYYFPQALEFHGARWGPEKHGDTLNGSLGLQGDQTSPS